MSLKNEMIAALRSLLLKDALSERAKDDPRYKVGLVLPMNFFTLPSVKENFRDHDFVLVDIRGNIQNNIYWCYSWRTRKMEPVSSRNIIILEEE